MFSRTSVQFHLLWHLYHVTNISQNKEYWYKIANILLNIILLHNEVGGESLIVGEFYPQLYLLIQSLDNFLQATKKCQGEPRQRASDWLQDVFNARELRFP